MTQTKIQGKNEARDDIYSKLGEKDLWMKIASLCTKSQRKRMQAKGRKKQTKEMESATKACCDLTCVKV